MATHAKDENGALFLEVVIDEPVLDVDPPGAGVIEVAHQLFVARRALEWIDCQNVEKSLRLTLKTGRCELACGQASTVGTDGLRS